MNAYLELLRHVLAPRRLDDRPGEGRRVDLEPLGLSRKAAASPAGLRVAIHGELGQVRQSGDLILDAVGIEAAPIDRQGEAASAEAEAVELAAGSASTHPEGRAGKFVCLRVSDTGVGIPADQLPRIFEPFFTTKPAGKGTGLGLSVAKRIIHDHGGEISIDSREGKGTSVIIKLPAYAEEKQIEQA